MSKLSSIITLVLTGFILAIELLHPSPHIGESILIWLAISIGLFIGSAVILDEE